MQYVRLTTEELESLCDFVNVGARELLRKRYRLTAPLDTATTKIRGALAQAHREASQSRKVTR
jgi:hypothetical protein